MGELSRERIGQNEAPNEQLAASREQVIRNSHTKRAVAQTERYLESGDPADLVAAGNSLTRGQERTEFRGVDEMIAAKDQIFTMEKINALPKLPGKFDIRSGAPGGDEQKMLQQIKRRMTATAQLKASHIDKRRPSGLPKPYLVPYKGTYVIKRDLVERDLVFLSDPLRIDQNPDDDAVLPQEREQVFKAYRALLIELLTLQRPQDERRYQGKYGSVAVQKKIIEDHCRPGSLKGPGKFLLLSGVVTLLGLWGVMDFRKKQLSFGTVGLMGAAAFLAKSGSKFDFMKTRYFAEFAKNGLDGEMIKKLQNFSRTRAAAFGNMIKVFEGQISHEERLSQATIDKVINPTKKRGGRTVPDVQKRVPKELAQLFLGKAPGASGKVLRGLRSTARSKDREVVSTVAEANANGKDLQTELQAAQSKPQPEPENTPEEGSLEQT